MKKDRELKNNRGKDRSKRGKEKKQLQGWRLCDSKPPNKMLLDKKTLESRRKRRWLFLRDSSKNRLLLSKSESRRKPLKELKRRTSERRLS